MKGTDAKRVTGTDQWFRYWLPYQFVKLESGKRRHLYLPLNRNYKPLGQASLDWVNYEDYAAQAVVFAQDPSKFRGIWHDLKGLYLYDDNRSSREDYFGRLEKLLSRSVRLASKC